MEICKIEDEIVPVGIKNMFLCLKNICRALHKNESVANNQRLARNMELLFHFTLLS
jgi:hypothetical protein